MYSVIIMKIGIYTLGCKVNQYESELISQQLKNAGHTVVKYTEDAEIYIINSCTVTSESDRKSRQAVRRFKKKPGNPTVILTGCMSQANPDIFDTLQEADIVIGNNNNNEICNLINQYCSKNKRIKNIKIHSNNEPFPCGIINDFSEHTRAEVKIEDGCNRFCSYCLIPYARGRVRSKPLEDLKKEISYLNEKNFSEIVLVGINLSAYGLHKDFNICDAVEIAASFENIKRVRLGSLEPDHITDEILARLAKCEKFCPQFHISLQSGSTEILKKMNRHYTAEEYETLAHKIRNTFKDATLTTDVIVGFPGETEENFSQSVEFVKRIGFEKIHVFPYSPRVGTPAAKMKQISPEIKENRSHIMLETAEDLRKMYFKSIVGKTFEVLIEKNNEGYTENYTPIKVNEDISSGKFVKVKVTDFDSEKCYGIKV